MAEQAFSDIAISVSKMGGRWRCHVSSGLTAIV